MGCLVAIPVCFVGFSVGLALPIGHAIGNYYVGYILAAMIFVGFIGGGIYYDEWVAKKQDGAWDETWASGKRDSPAFGGVLKKSPDEATEPPRKPDVKQGELFSDF